MCVLAVIEDAALLFEPNRSPQGSAVRESVLRFQLSQVSFLCHLPSIKLAAGLLSALLLLVSFLLWGK